MPVFPLQSLVALAMVVFGQLSWSGRALAQQACPPTDKQSAKLKAASAAPKSNITGFVTCTYDDTAGAPCNYFANGTFSNGPTVSCPDAIRTGFSCPSNSTGQQQLIGASVTTQQNFACTYATGSTSPALCLYDTHGAPVNGSGTSAACPPSAIPILNSTFNNAGGGSAFNSTSLNSTGNPCPQPNKAGTYFASSSTGPGASGMVSCTYADSTQCTYLSADGSLKFGPSSCPSAITPLASTAPGSATSSILVAAVARNSRRSSTITDDNLPPDIIALLVMSAVLVLGTLALGGLWWFSFHRRRSLPPPKPLHYRVVSVHEQDYGHGNGETYDDPYEPPSGNRR
ncbi:hypothetical protein C8R46DRAFT_1355903 [Mycena filopes]|nr:hypothetical protein C8R46DRAFT_1355903 [Mycena filopes]